MKKRWKRLLWIGLALLVAHVACEGIFSLIVARQAAQWEALQERDANGVLAGCAAYDLSPTPDETDENPTALLLVHGINASPRDCDLIAPALVEKGYVCRAMRLPGFAEPLKTYKRTTARAWVSSVQRELAGLRAEHDRVGLVAHSLGGAVAIGALIDEPQAADFAVLLAPAVEVSDSRSFLLSTRGWREVSKRTLWFVDLLPSPYAMDCRDISRHDQPGRTPFTPVAVVDELFALMSRNLPRAEEITLPLGMVVSRGDPIVSSPAAEAFFSRVVSDSKRLWVLEKSGHEVTLDHEWREVVEAIETIDRLAD